VPAASSPSLRPEDNVLDTPTVGNTPTRLLRITVEEDGSLTQSGLPVLDKAQLPQNLVTFINQAFSSNHSPPYLGPDMQIFPDVERLTKSFLAPGNVVSILVRDLADGNHIGPSDFIASFGLVTYQHPAERPDPINNPHSSSTVYIDPNGRESIRYRLYPCGLKLICSRRRRVDGCLEKFSRESVTTRSWNRDVDGWKPA